MLRTVYFLASIVLFTFSSCNTNTGDAKISRNKKLLDFDYNSSGIIAPTASSTSNSELPVDIYLDATYSMQGFAQPEATDFSRLLGGIEAIVQNATKESDIRFFKYGRSVAPLSREDFVAAKNNPSLWDDKDFRSETNFAQAVDSTDPNRVSIFITDLFYSNADANKVVSAIQDKVLKNGVEVGLLGLKSNFDGYVADVQPPVQVKGERPLYLLVFGSKSNINLIFSAFKNQPYINADQALLLTKYPLKDFSVTAVKSKDSKAINISSARKQFSEFGNVFAFSWNPDKGNDASVEYTIKYTAEPYSVPINPENIKAKVYKKDKAATDSVVDNKSLILKTNLIDSTKIVGKALVNLNLKEEDDFSAYQIIWYYDNLGKIQLPEWITKNSTQNFRQGNDENKTLELETLVRNLITNSATQLEPKYGKMYLVFIRK